MEQSEAGKPVKLQGNAENWPKTDRRHPVFTPPKLFSPSPWGAGKGGRKLARRANAVFAGSILTLDSHLNGAGHARLIDLERL